jgi:hypothetical protein
MKFKVGDDVIQAQIRKADRFASRSTGVELRRLSIEFHTGDTATQERVDGDPSIRATRGADAGWARLLLRIARTPKKQVRLARRPNRSSRLLD